MVHYFLNTPLVICFLSLFLPLSPSFSPSLIGLVPKHPCLALSVCVSLFQGWACASFALLGTWLIKRCAVEWGGGGGVAERVCHSFLNWSISSTQFPHTLTHSHIHSLSFHGLFSLATPESSPPPPPLLHGSVV